MIGAAVMAVGLGAVAALDAEQDAPNANITTIGDALWWAATTVTTVGYGDRYPVTTAGRFIAVTLMVVGIALVGAITASIAAWFVSSSRPRSALPPTSRTSSTRSTDRVGGLPRSPRRGVLIVWMLPDPSPFTTLSGTIVTMRKIVGVVGACLVVLGFLGSILALSTERLATWWFLLPAVLAIPAGFVLLWEAQVTWPRDGSPYPWQRRGAGGLVALLTIVVVVTIHGALRATLPDNWMADTLAQVIGISVGLTLFKRLRQLMSRRLYDGNSRPMDRTR